MADDFIRRSDAVAHPFANGKYDRAHANEHFILGHESYKEWLEQLPAADVRPVVHAWWIWCKDHWECSACGGNRFHDLTLGMDAAYCGRCGATMDETAA